MGSRGRLDFGGRRYPLSVGTAFWLNRGGSPGLVCENPAGGCRIWDFVPSQEMADWDVVVDVNIPIQLMGEGS